MEEKDSLIAQLQNEVKARNSEVVLAAKYGKLLGEENTNLRLKIDELLVQNEELIQEKYSLQLKLDTETQANCSLMREMEVERERVDSLSEKFQINEKGNGTLFKKNESLTKEVQYLKKVQDDLTIENNSLKERINVLLKQVSNFEDQAEKSMCETDKDESQDLKAQLSVYMLNNKELKDVLSHSQYELENAKKNEKHLLQMVHELEETVNEKNTELTTCHEEIKLAKEEIEELQGEIEVLKFDQVDVNKRGNSVFAELDDRRTQVERKYKELVKKYQQFQKDYEENKKELDRSRGQMAFLQSMVSRGHQQAYINQLEDLLVSLRQENNDWMHKYSKALKDGERKSVLENSSAKNEYDYLRVMLQMSQKKEKELQTEVFNLKAKIMHDSDELFKSNQLLHKAKEDLDYEKQENFKLKQTVKDLEQGIMHKLSVEPTVQKPKIEILDGFKPPSTVSRKVDLNKSNFNNCLDLEDIIPGELELGEDGFRQVRPPRKSNRYILKEFNRIEPDDEKCEKPSKLVFDKNELVEKDDKMSLNATSKKNEFDDQKVRKDVEKHKPMQRSHIKHSNRRNDNCAQQ